MRRNGMLLPIASLPSPYGIGAFSKEAYEFIDLLKETGQKLWQILPLGPTSYGDSPYQSFSTFAGNPYFIDLETLIEKGLLTKEECETCDYGDHPSYIDYGKIYNCRFALLKKAFLRSEILEDKDFLAFCEENAYWLSDYALYMAVKNKYEGKSWIAWDEDIRLRKPEALQRYSEELKEECAFYQFLQYEFFEQWQKVKAYAHEKGIEIVGDIPIYVAFDSADTWANPELFQLDEDCLPSAVAGCPPDAFSATGQLWGNPLYDWKYHKKTGYQWWLQRIAHCFQLYDIVRIDHFRGFDEYFSIPYGDDTAVNGHWEKGPGMDLFCAMKEELGELNIIAEDLGFLTESVYQLLEDSGYPGMKVLQFAFDPGEDSDYLTYKYDRNCVVYTGTHDNDTTLGWFAHMAEWDKDVAIRYMNNFYTPEDQRHWDLIALAMRSEADTCIIPVQDFLGLGSEARINMPSTLVDNWKWRMTKDAFSEELKQKIWHMTKLYGRL